MKYLKYFFVFFIILNLYSFNKLVKTFNLLKSLNYTPRYGLRALNKPKKAGGHSFNKANRSTERRLINIQEEMKSIKKVAEGIEPSIDMSYGLGLIGFWALWFHTSK